MLQVGFGVGDITPEVGMEMPGGFARRVGKGVRDKLLTVACVIHDGKTTAALVGIDALFITRPTVEHARRLILKNTKISPDNVLIGANHTHSGGPVASCLGCDENPKYTDQVAKSVAAAVGDAWNSLHAAEIGVGVGQETNIAFNRRFVMRDGREITHPGKPWTPHHADIVGPAGPVDPEVGVLAVRTPETKGPDGKPSGGKVVGVVVHFTCHSTVVGGDQFSPDYTAYLRKHLQSRYGPEIPVCFLLGPCGDITQVDNMSTAVQSGPDYADMMGRKLAAEAIRTVGGMRWQNDVSVAAAVETVALPIRAEPDVNAERPPFGLGSGQEDAYENERKLVADLRKKKPRMDCEVQAIRIGPLGIVTNGAEYFCEYGLRIKRCSPFRPTWVVTLANEWIGYVPTAQAFVGGGYEPRTARSSMLAWEAGQRLAETALQALGKVAPKNK